MLLQRVHRYGVSGVNGFRVGRDDLVVSVMQHFDQAVFQLEALMEQGSQLVEFGGQLFAIRTMILAVTTVIEVQSDLGDLFYARIQLTGQFKPALIIKCFRFLMELIVNLEVARRHVVDQHLAKLFLGFTLGIRGILLDLDGFVSLHELCALMQPVINQLVDAVETLLSILATL